MSADWNPSLYTRFEDERSRPAAELLARVPLDAAARVTDLGCGPGNSTELLALRYPQADITGLDSSVAMLEAARGRLPALRFEQGDIARWAPAQPQDLIFANASLQWLGGHEHLLPRLLSQLAPGGVLAVQMPDNLDEPSHRLMRALATEPPFAAHLGKVSTQRQRLPDISRYYDLLAPHCQQLDLWHTRYQHRMADAAAIVQWLSATGLRPFVQALPPTLQPEFLARYEQRLDQAYPARVDGARLLAFPRLFIVAQVG